MKQYIRMGFFLLVGINIIFAAWYVLHGEIHFFSDIGRDFLIYDEISQKGLILIGGRTSSGLYHGPLWWYLNYPAYWVSGGNPLAVAWYWILLIIAALVSGYFAAKDLFGKSTAYIFVLLLSLTYVFHANVFINPHGAMLVMPLFFYFFIKYLKTFRVRYLIFHLISLGAIIQFEMADGLPLLILSCPVIAFFAIKNKKIMHLLSYGIIAVSVSNFVFFDIRHHFLLYKKAIDFASPHAIPGITFSSMIQDRVSNLLYKIEFIRNDHGYLNSIPIAAIAIFIALQIWANKYKTIYVSFIYFFIGFFILSLINKGNLLPFYLYPIFPLVFLIFSSFITSRYKLLFFLIAVVIYMVNFQAAIQQIQDSGKYIGRNKESWKFLYTLSSHAFEGQEKELGYFVYSPDAYGYGPKYAIEYAAKTHSQKRSYAYQKRHVTYLVAEPPPPDNKFMQDKWWQENQLNIKNTPVKTIYSPNGYKLEKFILTDQEIKIPYNPVIDIGLHFR